MIQAGQAGHSLWQEYSSPNRLAFITEYLTQEAADTTDAVFETDYAPRIAEHERTFQMTGWDYNMVPTRPDIFGLALYFFPGPEDELPQSLRHDFGKWPGNWGVLSGVDVWPKIPRSRMELPEALNEYEEMVVVGSWKESEDFRASMNSLGRTVENWQPKHVSFYKKIMGLDAYVGDWVVATNMDHISHGWPVATHGPFGTKI